MDKNIRTDGMDTGGKDVPAEERKTQELLAELLTAEKQQSGLLRALLIVNGILAAVILVAVLTVVPRIMHMASDVDQFLGGIDQIVEDANTILEDADRMVQDANQIMKDTSEDMETALDHFNSVDFESLNRAIKDLADVVEPLAGLAQLF